MVVVVNIYLISFHHQSWWWCSRRAMGGVLPWICRRRRSINIRYALFYRSGKTTESYLEDGELIDDRNQSALFLGCWEEECTDGRSQGKVLRGADWRQPGIGEECRRRRRAAAAKEENLLGWCQVSVQTSARNRFVHAAGCCSPFSCAAVGVFFFSSSFLSSPVACNSLPDTLIIRRADGQETGSGHRVDTSHQPGFLLRFFFFFSSTPQTQSLLSISSGPGKCSVPPFSISFLLVEMFLIIAAH